MNTEKNCRNIAIYEFAYDKIKLTDPEWSHAFRLEEEYLATLNPDRLLAGFLETAGYRPKAERYPGWEMTEIQGHTLGHFLTAAAQIYASAKNPLWLEKMDYIIEELYRCQQEDGYLFASPREIFDRVENGQPAWVPWYTMHKILSGIIKVYEITNHQTAYRIMGRLGTWIADRTEGWTKEIRDRVLSVEYGGMNDCLYDLFLITGEERFARAAHQFDERTLFEALHDQKDVLNGLHANTTIPKILGALKRYMVFGKTEKFYLVTAQNFWEIVVKHHTYATGGNSEWEHFGEPDVLDAERTACNCETCNTYNMLKLSLWLFQITGDKKYMDYYDHTKLNAILASQNPETGMTMYFQPMETGYFKVFTTPYSSFWCCTGSGMENFTKLQEGIYFHNEEGIYICRYVSSDIVWTNGRIALKMEVVIQEDTLAVRIRFAEVPGRKFSLYLRIPDWLEEDTELFLNGTYLKGEIQNGYVFISREWVQNDMLDLHMKMTLKIQGLPDNERVAAFSYGPYLLSAGLGNVMMDMTVTGVDVFVPQKEITVKDYLILQDVEINDWKKHIERYLVKEKGRVAFRLNNQGEELIFTPHYARYRDRYGIYFRLYKKESRELVNLLEKEKQAKRLKNVMTDVIPVGNDQYELAHGIKGEKTDTMRLNGHPYRFCREDGWFSYRMKLQNEKQELCMTLCGQDVGNSYRIVVDGVTLVEDVVKKEKDEFYQAAYQLPLMSKPDHEKIITVKFQNLTGEGTFRIFDELYLKKCDERNK